LARRFKSYIREKIPKIITITSQTTRIPLRSQFCSAPERIFIIKKLMPRMLIDDFLPINCQNPFGFPTMFYLITYNNTMINTEYLTNGYMPYPSYPLALNVKSQQNY
jgi:hypothetical protein